MCFYLKVQGGEQNNGNTKKLRNVLCVDYIERTLAGNTECSSICLHYVLCVDYIERTLAGNTECSSICLHYVMLMSVH
jgi:hypothetical protein